jgi:hypothetical protein
MTDNKDINLQNPVIDFLRKTASEIENNTVSHDVLLGAYDFFITTNSPNNPLDEKNMLKYFFMGWYIYNNLEKKENKNNLD